MFMYIGMKELSYAACQVLRSQGDVSTVPFWDNLLINVIIEEFTANLYNVFWRALEVVGNADNGRLSPFLCKFICSDLRLFVSCLFSQFPVMDENNLLFYRIDLIFSS